MKTYKSFGRKIQMVVELGEGVIRTIEFKRDIVIPESNVWGSVYSTDDKELQKAIESHKYFGKRGQAVVWTDEPRQKKEDKKAKNQD